MCREYVYVYDGSFEGMLCCIYESFLRKEIPIAIESEVYGGRSCFTMKKIETDEKKSDYISHIVREIISLRASELIEHAFLSDLPDKEFHILYFIRLGLKYGEKVLEMRYQEDVESLFYAESKLLREAHAMSGLIKFYKEGGLLTAKISPKNNILPLLAAHLCRKMSGRDFAVYDSTHGTTFIHKDGTKNFVPYRT